MKKFWKRRVDDYIVIASTSSDSVDDSIILNPVTLGGGLNSSPVVFQYQSSRRGNVDKISTVIDARSEHSNKIMSSVSCGNTASKRSVSRSVARDIAGSKGTLRKAYKYCSHSIYVVASSVDGLLTTCSDSLCVQADDESTFASLSIL